MSARTIDITCPGCGGPIGYSDKICGYCGRPVMISTFNSVYNMPTMEVNKYVRSYRQTLSINPDNPSINLALAYCYLKLKMYDQAISCFAKGVEDNFDNSESFFYTAIALLRGKKAFVAKRPDINKAIEYLEAANMIEPKGIYHYLLAYIKYDYFFRKGFRINPDYMEELISAKELGYSKLDLALLYELLNVECPVQLN